MANTRYTQQNSLLIEFPFTGLDETTVLENNSGETAFSLDDINWRDVVLETTITTLTGTSTPTVNATVITNNGTVGFGMDTSSPSVLQGDGSTVFKSANLTAAGTGIVALNPQAASGETKTNLGRNIGVKLVVVSGTVTNAAGTVRLYIKGQ